MDEWYKTAFSRDYIRIYQHRDSSEAEGFVNRLLSQITLPGHPFCLDLGCGFGRHLAYLNNNGVKTVGIDLSSDLLEFASKTEATRGLLIQADMRAIPFSANFDFVFSFFSSFGYFADDAENLMVLKEIYRVLKPTGGFVIDYMNARFTKENFVAEDHKQFPEFELRQRRWVNHHTNSIEKELLIKDADGEKKFRESLKLYGVDDFLKFCSQANLKVTKMLGDYDGSLFNDQANRLIVIGEKRECGT